MDCREAFKVLHPYLDRELSDVEVQEVERHLGGCDDCGQFFAFKRELKRLVQIKGCPETAPAELRDAVERLRSIR